MSNPGTDKVFTGSIPKLYETYMVPLIFEPYAADLANRLASRSLTRVLEPPGYRRAERGVNWAGHGARIFTFDGLAFL